MSLGEAIVVTISDSSARGQREDLSGPEAKRILEETGFEVVEIRVIPDEPSEIEDCLKSACSSDASLVVTTGGTGLSPRDVTPEATASVIEKSVPGMAELMRAEGLKHTPRAALSRGLVGIRASTLILNLPGSVRGVRESLGAVVPILKHAVEVLAGQPAAHRERG